MSNWEWSHTMVSPRVVRAVMFDFDGTLSLIREGWAHIMAELGWELLLEQRLVREPQAELMAFLEREMLLLSGKPSLFQMQRLSDEVQTRGGIPLNSEILLEDFLRRLKARVQSRIVSLERGEVPPNAWTVPGSHALLESIQSREIPLYLASGTDRVCVLKEAQLLGLTKFFDERIFAPEGNSPNFNKRDVVAKILETHAIPGEQLLSFGDGYSETVEVKRIGGLAVGVASHEVGIPGVNAMKRQLLLELGADGIVPDYSHHELLLDRLITP
jgi:phosphoglycolate phosphatase